MHPKGHLGINQEIVRLPYLGESLSAPLIFAYIRFLLIMDTLMLLREEYWANVT